MALIGKIDQFRYFPFLNKLVTTGQVTWETPENTAADKLITRLYIDGDMMYWHPVDEHDLPLDVSEEVRLEHARKINRDLASVNVLAGHLGVALAFFTALLGWLFNPEYLLEQTLVITAISVIGYFTRRITFPMIFKIIGAVVNVVSKKR